MHRTTLVPRLLSMSFMAVAALLACQSAARAQPGPDQTQISVLMVPLNTTKQVEMSTKQRIKEVRNENPKVCKVQSLLENPNAVLITGLAPGNSRVTLADVNGKIEALDVTVPSDEEELRKQVRDNLVKLIRTVSPTSNVDVIAAPNNTIILSGVVANAEAVQPIIETARSFFGDKANVVNSMRLAGVQQVELEVTVALVNRSELREFGFNFDFSRTGTGLTALSTIFGDVRANQTVHFEIMGTNWSFLGYLDALRTNGLAKVMSSPRIVTLSGRSAKIHSGGSIDIVPSSGGTSFSGSASGATHIDFGTTVDVLPIVLGDGRIHLEVAPTISDPDPTVVQLVGGTGSTNFGLTTRQAQSTVELEDGQTLAIGGLIQNKVNAVSKKLPVLGDLPFVATFFSSKTYSNVEEELVILVTPRLVDPMACTQLPKYLPGRETRTPDDFELFLEGILEAPRGQRQVFPDGFTYVAAHKSGFTSDLYPCGDSPYPHNGGACGLPGCTSCQTGNCASGQCGAVSMGGTYTPVSAGSTKTMPATSASRIPTTMDAGGTRQAVEVIVDQPTSGRMPQGRDVPSNMPAFGDGDRVLPALPPVGLEGYR